MKIFSTAFQFPTVDIVCGGMHPLSWEPDPVEADPLKGSRYRRKVDILGMIVGIIGSKDQLVNEYRVMLAEKLLNKSDYDIDSEIRTLELLKVFHKDDYYFCNFKYS